MQVQQILCEVKENDAIEENTARVRDTPFYNFMKENRDFVISLDPSMTELEVVAFLQAKWQSMSLLGKEAFTSPDQRQKFDPRLSQTSDEVGREAELMRGSSEETRKEIKLRQCRDRSHRPILSDKDEESKLPVCIKDIRKQK